jgi:hypothetical protein
MNADLFHQLVQLGVYRRPALEIARRFPDADMTRAVITAFKAHVRETDSIPIAVWRLQNGILLTGGQIADEITLPPRLAALHTQSPGLAHPSSDWPGDTGAGKPQE